MKPKVHFKSSKGFNLSDTKFFHSIPDVFYPGRFVRHAIANYISKQFLSQFANFYLLVKH